MTAAAEDRGVAVSKGRDIWIRARTNAFAHKIAAERTSRASAWAFVIQTALVVIAILCVALALQVATSRSIQPFVPKGGVPSVDANAMVAVRESPWLNIFGIVAILSNTFALFLSMLTSHFKWSEQTGEHLHLLASYQLIAQRARRLDASEMSVAEMHHLCRHLEETFEIYKTTGREPTDKQFVMAQELMRRMKSYPFEIAADSL